jgi:hypothetical protein
MNSRLVVDEHNELKEYNDPAPVQARAVRIGAELVSWIFHPVFLPVYIIAYMLYRHPYLFAGYSDWQKIRILLMGGLMFTFFPLVTVLLLRALKFIDSIYLRTQKDRIIPFVATMIWYFWIWYVWKNLAEVPEAVEMPREAVQFALACFVSTILGLMINIRMKISLHAIGVGVCASFLLLVTFTQGLHSGFYLSLMIFVAGLVCTARLIVSDHSPKEIYVGLLTGTASMLIASFFG